MHLHCHLKDIIIDHGPVYSFWCFSFDRYNGIMGNIFTNKRSHELQLIRKLMVQRFLDNTKLPSHYQEDFLGLLHSPNASESCITQSDSCTLSNMSTIILVTLANWSDLSNIILPSSYKVRSLESDEQLSLWTVYKVLYTEQVIEKNYLAETIKTYSSVTLGNLFYGSKSDCRSLRSARIYASWAMADEDKLNLEQFIFLLVMFCFICPILLS